LHKYAITKNDVIAIIGQQNQLFILINLFIASIRRKSMIRLAIGGNKYRKVEIINGEVQKACDNVCTHE
jgi:1-aminocyclopropane-1-carboxylate deaminase/D-cysteine desulfhydrase-like pyridoxal-dependent ACC family enzyme